MSASLIISVCAIGLTLYGLYATRRHNRLSVMPHLGGCSNRVGTPEGTVFTYDISNNGIGPAKIRSFKIFRDGKLVPKEKIDYIGAAIREHFGQRINYQIKHQFNFGDDACMKAGNSVRLVEILFPDSGIEEIESFFEGLYLKIEYQSFYGQKHCMDSRGQSK